MAMAETPQDGMADLVEMSSLGSPQARRLRSLTDSSVVDRLLGLHTEKLDEPVATTPGHQPSGDGGSTEWMDHGSCAHEDPTLFFPGDGVGVEIARRICATCPVKEPCLEHALSNRVEHGVWGGASERERRRILKRRSRQANLVEGSSQVGDQTAQVVDGSPTRASSPADSANPHPVYVRPRR